MIKDVNKDDCNNLKCLMHPNSSQHRNKMSLITINDLNIWEISTSRLQETVMRTIYLYFPHFLKMFRFKQVMGIFTNEKPPFL